MRTVDVLRPNPIRTEQCLVLDKLRRHGGEHIKVRAPDGAEFMAEKYMGQWGQPDGWFDRLPDTTATPARKLSDQLTFRSGFRSVA